MTGSRPNRSLSDRALRVLRSLASTPAPDWRALEAATGITGRGLFDSLGHLQGRMLVRWDQGGRNIRVTKRGADLLQAAHYRRRAS